MSTKALLCLIPSAAFGLCFAAHAQTSTGERHATRLEQRFRAADSNGDSALSKAEADAAGMHRQAKHFDRLDANKDGRVTGDELRRPYSGGMGQLTRPPGC